MERKLIQSYENFDLMGVYKKGVFLYKEAMPKPLPTVAENYRIILRQQLPINITPEEKEIYAKESRELDSTYTRADIKTRNDRIIEALKTNEKSYEQIGIEYGVKRNVVYNIAKKNGLSRPEKRKSYPTDLIAKAKTMIKDGYSGQIIFRELGVHPNKISRIKKEMESNVLD